jgi:hypothetical protein
VVKVRIRIKITRYQRDKELGKEYRADPNFTGSFTDYIKQKKKEKKFKS